jgi:dolichyl-phosphate beta-glucosyltransferase
MAEHVKLSYIVPAHNSEEVIEDTLQQLATRFAGRQTEILVVENGSTDDTPALLRDAEAVWTRHDVTLRVLSTERGLGNALRHGIAESRGDRIFLGADDLPFGFDDLVEAELIDPNHHPVVIGSKGHPKSIVHRSPTRVLLTFGFRLLRRVILGMRTRDPQGTFVLDGAWARSVVARVHEPGYLFSTELCHLAECSGIVPVEVPVRLRPSHGSHTSRVQLRDVWRMGAGLLTVRRRHGAGPAVGSSACGKAGSGESGSGESRSSEAASSGSRSPAS